MSDHVTYCSICRKPVMRGNTPVGDVVDHFVYEFDGTLDYIELMHRSCAKHKGYRIQGDTVMEAAINERDNIERFMWSYVSRDNKVNGKAVRVGGTMTSPVKLTITQASAKSPVFTREFPNEGQARNYWKQYVRNYNNGLYESQQVGTHIQVDEMLPEPHEEEVQRVKGQFQVVDRKGRPFGKPHASYTAAQHADQAARKTHYTTRRMQGEAVSETATIRPRYIVKREMRSLDCSIYDTDAKKTVKTYRNKAYDDDDYDTLKAANGECARMNRAWIESKEKADGKKYRIVWENSDAAPAISRNECNIKQFGKVKLEVAGKGK